jgi:hypothetical protein
MMEERRAFALAEMEIQPRLPTQTKAPIAERYDQVTTRTEPKSSTATDFPDSIQHSDKPDSPPSDTGPRFSWDNTNNFGSDEKDRAFRLDKPLKNSFKWKIDAKTRVSKVEWKVRQDAEGPFDHIIAVAESEPILHHSQDPKFKFKDGPFYSVKQENGAGEAVFNLQGFGDDDSGYFSHGMIMEVSWTLNGQAGFAQSGLFTVVQNEAQANVWLAGNFVKGPLEQTGTVSPEPVADMTGSIPMASSEPTIAASSSTIQPPLSTSSNPANGSSDSSSGGELSTGAIAGIAVGGAAAVIILITAIFFLYRRRHRKRLAADRAGYDGQRGATTYFTDKENNRVPDTPQTPYSEDGAHRLPPSSVPGLALTHDDIEPGPRQPPSNNATDGNSTFVPYKNPDPATSRTDLATRSGTALSSNIAHLVEDGMTDDEIRRLEEEERQLDDAIAQARRR